MLLNQFDVCAFFGTPSLLRGRVLLGGDSQRGREFARAVRRQDAADLLRMLRMLTRFDGYCTTRRRSTRNSA